MAVKLYATNLGQSFTTGRQTDRSWTDRQKEKQTDRQADRWAVGQTDKQTNRWRDR